jgi:hypothetical protein
MDAIKLIEQRCRDKKTNLHKICKELGLKSMYFSRWKRNEPTAIKYLNAVNQHLDGIN